MKNKKTLFVILGIVILFIIAFYYYYPRKVAFHYKATLLLPYEGFNHYDRMYYYYISDKNQLFKFLEERAGYDSLYIKKISAMLDFEHFHYILTFNKQLLYLRHSPKLTNEDAANYLEKTPLYPIYDNIFTKNAYLYELKKNTKYRSLGP